MKYSRRDVAALLPLVATGSARARNAQAQTTPAPATDELLRAREHKYVRTFSVCRCGRLAIQLLLQRARGSLQHERVALQLRQRSFEPSGVPIRVHRHAAGDASKCSLLAGAGFLERQHVDQLRGHPGQCDAVTSERAYLL